MQGLLKKEVGYKIEIFILSITILFHIFRHAIPFFKYPFILLFLFITAYSIIKYKQVLPSKLKEFGINYSLILLLTGIFFLSFLLSYKIYLTIFKDVLDAIILLIFFFLLSLISSPGEKWKYFTDTFTNLIIYFSLLISLMGMGVTFNIFSSSHPFTQSGISSGIELFGNDVNFALLPVFFGVFSIFKNLAVHNSLQKKWLYYLILIINTLGILFSGSRRGMIIFSGILLIMIFLQAVILIKPNFRLKKFCSIALPYLASVMVLSLFLYFIVFHTSFSFKEKALRLIGSKNTLATKERIAFIATRYSPLLNKEGSYFKVYNTLWSASLDPNDKNSSFDPKDPESIWGTRIHKTVFPLTGENVEIVPPGTKGYLMDSTCNADTWSGNAYSYTLIGRSEVKDNDYVKSSVYCYVSNDFDGEWAILYSSRGAIGQCNYDLKKKGTWQKLSINLRCKEAEEMVHLYFAKFGVTDFSTLKGYVIFAYPLFEIYNEHDTIKSYYNFLPEVRTSDHNRYILAENKSVKNERYTGKYLNSLLPELKISGIYSNMLNAVEQDPVRNWVSKFISEDTTYMAYNASILVDTSSSGFISTRTSRWIFAIQVFIKEYDWPERIMGGGFKFLNWYGYYFYRDKTRSDYPHNPFLYILLYSGIIGLILYMFLIFRVFYLYIKYLKEYLLFALFFLLTYFFTFFGGGNPLNPPIMGFFIILPFYFHSIHKNK